MDNSITAVKIEEAGPQDLLERLIRQGARSAFQAALEDEVNQFLQRFSKFRDDKGHRMAVRNGYLPERSILSGIGPLEIRQPRVDDPKLRRTEGGERSRARFCRPTWGSFPKGRTVVGWARTDQRRRLRGTFRRVRLR